MASVGGDNNGGQDFDLQLAPIIDAFTVLIAFLLASAGFLSIGLLDAGIAAAGATPKNAKPPAVNVSLKLEKNFSMTLETTGKQNSKVRIPGKNNEWNYELLDQRLKQIAGRWKNVESITLDANDSIPYKDIVHSMNRIRKTMPVVMLGGF